MNKLAVSLLALAVPAFPSFAQDNPLSTSAKFVYTIVKGNLTKAADKMPEENYSFKPTPEVRSFGQLVGHVADANYSFCSAAGGEKNPGLNIEKTKTAKADLVAALKESFDYCDKVYNGLTDAAASEKVKFFGRESVKLGVLMFHSAHADEHYGNEVTYMRLKGIVPPSSEGRR